MQQQKRYKMIIIDDEYLVRLGLKETIDWEKYQIEVVAEGKNGRQGLELINQFHPDIVISDIKMPIMDGLDLVNAIKENNIDTCIIMLSGYKDFEYAKEALENGAYQYLLKPIDNQKLVEAVLAGVKKLEEKRETSKKLNNIENDYKLITSSIIYSILNKDQTSEKIKQLIDNYHLEISNYGLILNVKKQNEIKNADQLEELINQALKDEHLKFAYIITTKELIYIINDISTKNTEQIFKKIINSYTKISQELISIGISDNYHNFEDIKNKALQAKNFSENKIYQTISTITTSTNDSSHYHQTVIEGLKYIANNYQNDISIKTCAKFLYVSESHLMHVFKNDLNKTFNSCITEYRMLIAKNLINQNKYKIYEISEKVGINDTKYFSQLFKKIYGVTPDEYRKNRH